MDNIELFFGFLFVFVFVFISDMYLKENPTKTYNHQFLYYQFPSENHFFYSD